MRQRFVPIQLLVICLLLALCVGCGPDHQSLAGHYTAQTAETAVQLDLKENGDGEWTVEDGAAMAFRWSHEHGKLVLRTKTGGMLAGETDGQAIHLELPGMGRLTFLPS